MVYLISVTIIFSATTEAETALSVYNSFPNQFPYKPIWAVGENYRFEPAFVEVQSQYYNFFYHNCYLTNLCLSSNLFILVYSLASWSKISVIWCTSKLSLKGQWTVQTHISIAPGDEILWWGNTQCTFSLSITCFIFCFSQCCPP